MNLLSTRPLPRRASWGGRQLALPLALLLVLSIVACGTFVKNAETVLQTAPPAYDAAMTFAEQNKTQLSHETLVAFEAVRLQFPPAYRAFDSALAAYIKSGSKDPADVKVLLDEVNRLISQLQTLCVLNGGPNLKAKK